MTDKTQPEALRLADRLQAAVQTYPQMSEDEPGGYASEVDQIMDDAAAELRRQHARIAELEAELEAARADSVLEYTMLLEESRGALWQPANVALCERIDAYLDAARKEAESHDKA